ncbi:AAA family ATPase [Verminephrobacter aporrectodeae]|uniref:AAA family ATPase n=1 Tax=Verminephrobacter aporrectodeae TaxID=1110389 RepID=UPI0002375392|nr:AAA family ATPase [Verminephrobacter aporrectodeae]MCW5222911.1 hypothetical protein [Verminephrobacter aporrectodeae subsp. tuberculatae]MCW5256868.1 hypothetical protein [Verminephrobacter aporrectodeae subsp. tuberculatae]MCW5288375.1 hypothetical protein [Verminephrobacter aporrectodeae subsp. tuberculatae]MCW8166059.1 hypothetical protein [Verminephrobacter aporrectodeae subsp. tuberculatae]MCW8170068.1 hypothetical protein [Verminephrobacter aporrectodeae subsp. tuberculatae]
MAIETTAPKARLQGRIQRVSINGFRSLADVRDLELPQLTVLIGANGSGKSNLIRFFEMLAWMLRGQNLQEFVTRNGGGDDQLYMGARRTPRMNGEISIITDRGVNDYRFGLAHVSGNDTLMFVDEAYRYSGRQFETKAKWMLLQAGGREASLVAANHQTARVVVSLLKRCTTYQFHDTSAHANIKLPWDMTDFTWLRSDGANLAPILLRMQETQISRYKTIVQQIARVLPGFAEFELQPAYGKLALRWRSVHSEKTFGAHLTSDGSLRLFCLLTLLNLPEEMLPDVMFFDEPELGLHPHAIELVAEMIKTLAKARQIFIATQSPHMVDCFALDDVIVANNHDGATQLRTLPHEHYQRWLDEEYFVSDVGLSEPAAQGM